MKKSLKHFDNKQDLLDFAMSEFNDRFDQLCNDVFLSFLPANFPPGLDYDQLPFKEPYGLPKGYLFNVFGFPGEFSLKIAEGIQVATAAAMVSCMSMLDFLGGIYEGSLQKSIIFNASVSGGKTGAKVPKNNSCVDYVFRFMGYNRPIMRLILQIYSEKIPQISFADPIFQLGQTYTIQQGKKRMRLPAQKKLTWEISIGSKLMHLKIKSIKEEPQQLMYLRKEIPAPDYRLFFDISKFVEDIINSVFKPKVGYLAALETDSQLQKNFDRAVGHLYGL